MSDCTRVEGLVARWQGGEQLSAGDLGSIEAHRASCRSCAGRFSALVPFLRRDIHGPAVDPSADPGPGFTDAVMRRIARTPAKAAPRLAWVLAAAAGIVLALGLGLTAYRLGAARAGTEVVVHFQLAAPGAASVALVGSFTDWETSRLSMSDTDRDGVWEISVRLRRDAIHTYNFLIDGERWVADPDAQGQVDDGFGGQSSVVAL
jgi:hypothetical protein